MRALVDTLVRAIEHDRARSSRPEPGADVRGEAVALLSEMVGALTMARAVRDVDPALSDTVLSDARSDLLRRSDGH